MNLEDWVKKLAQRPELMRKQAVMPIMRSLKGGGGGRFCGLGDDCGYLDCGGFHLLLTVDSIREGLLERPRYAGFCAVNVAVNDIYATGGLPLGVADSLHFPSGDEDWAAEVAGGLRDGCDFFQLEMLGGHLDPCSSRRGLSVAGLGRAARLLTTFGAAPGDQVIMAFDPHGEWDAESLIWDASSGRDPQRVLENYAVLLEVAEGGLATSCRDVSNAGIAGTLAALAAACGAGASLDLDKLPRPPQVALEDWLAAFPSYGFILTAAPRRSGGLVGLFRLQGLEAEVCGSIEEGGSLSFRLGGEKATVDNPLKEEVR